MASKSKKQFKNPVEVTCYDETKTWERDEAIEFFTEGMFATEGSESERYRNIVRKLQSGLTKVDDNW